MVQLIRDYWGMLVAVVAAIAYVVLKLVGVDFEPAPLAVLLVSSSLGLWLLWRYPSIHQAARVLISIVTAVVVAGLMYYVYLLSRPRFEVTALDTLELDRNAYELTDQLIWNQDNLDEYGVEMVFTLEIVPKYDGRRGFGSVVAIISGDGTRTVEKELWPDFDGESGTQRIPLTLDELLRASGLRLNSDPPTNPFRPGDPFFQQVKLVVQIARAAGKAHPWATEEVTVRNAPWEFRSALMSRNGRREADIYVRNLGGTGRFTIRYRLARLEKEIDPTNEVPESSGTDTIACWNEPTELVRLEKGEFFTDTVVLPEELPPGRYLLEAYAVKKQNYVQFKDPTTTWENLNSMDSPWWFGQYPSDRHLFVVTTPEFPIDAAIQTEWERLHDERDVDLGFPTGPVEEVTSATGTVGRREVFEEGEIYVHDGQAYALYGPILDHYEELGGAEYYRLGFPISSIHAVTSSLGTDGAMMQFEGPGDPHPPTVIYASRKGVAAIWEWIGWVHSDNSWLGFPVADAQHLTDDSSVQPFERGYIFYHYPYVNGERDWREPVAYPYPAGQGTLFDVHAQQRWQDTGVQVQPGERVTIVQVDGTWTHWGPGEELYDANGYAYLGLQENTALPSAITGALIGRIGEEDGHAFSVGRWSVLMAPTQGTLYLAMNDNNYEDNAGFITVQIVVERSD